MGKKEREKNKKRERERERERTLFDSKLDLLDSGFIFTSSSHPFIRTGLHILLYVCMLKGNRKTI